MGLEELSGLGSVLTAVTEAELLFPEFSLTITQCLKWDGRSRCFSTDKKWVAQMVWCGCRGLLEVNVLRIFRWLLSHWTEGWWEPG